MPPGTESLFSSKPFKLRRVVEALYLVIAPDDVEAMLSAVVVVCMPTFFPSLTFSGDFATVAR